MAVAKTDLFCDGAQPSVSNSRNEWHRSRRVLVARAVLMKLVASVDTVVVAVTQIVLLHTQPVVAAPLALRARELVWTTNNTFIVTPFVFFLLSFICMVTYSHRCHFHSPSVIVISIHLGCHFHSPWLSFLCTLIVTSIHMDSHFRSPWSPFPFTLIVIANHLDRHFYLPWSSFQITWIVIYIHHHRHFYSTLLVLKFSFTFIVSCIHPHCHFHRHFHSPRPSFSFTFIVISVHLDSHLHSSWSSFPFTPMVVSIQRYCYLKFHSPSSLAAFTLIVIFIVISTHLDRHFHSTWSSVPFTLILISSSVFSSSSLQFKVIVTSFLLHRHCHLYRLFIYLHLLSFTLIVFAHVACHLQSSYYSSLSVSRTSKEHGARQDTDHLQSQRNWEPDKAQTISPAATELRARQDTNHLQRYRNLKADKTQPSLFRA